jgi:hypothetical protein
VPFNGSGKILLMRVLEAIIIAIIVAVASVYAQTIRQEVVNTYTREAIVDIKAQLQCVRTELSSLNNSLIAHEASQQVREDKFYGRSR